MATAATPIDRAELLKKFLSSPAGLATLLDPKWKPKRHLVSAARAAASCALRPNGRLIINMPPAHGKTVLIGKWLPVWYLTLRPHHKIIYDTYEQSVADDWGRRVRDTLMQCALPAKIRSDKSGVRDWDTTAGGGMISTGVGGPLTGRHADLIIVDDPHKNWAEAQSAVKRRHVWEWFEAVLYSRRKPGASIIVNATRWHRQDLTGLLITDHGDDWEHIRYPAIACGKNDPLGRQEGEPLCPDWFGLDDFAPLIASLRVWSAMYQQEPGLGGAGRAYHTFSDSAIDRQAELDPSLPVHVSFDWNISPGMHAIIGQVVGEFFCVSDEVHRPSMRIEQCVDEIAKIISPAGQLRFPSVLVFGDATGRARSPQTGTSSLLVAMRAMRQSADEKRVRLKIPAVNPNLALSVQGANDALAAGRVKINPRCNGLITDLDETQTDEEGMPDKGNSARTHFSDCLRYWITSVAPARLRVTIPKARFAL